VSKAMKLNFTPKGRFCPSLNPSKERELEFAIVRAVSRRLGRLEGDALEDAILAVVDEFADAPAKEVWDFCKRIRAANDMETDKAVGTRARTELDTSYRDVVFNSEKPPWDCCRRLEQIDQGQFVFLWRDDQDDWAGPKPKRMTPTHEERWNPDAD